MIASQGGRALKGSDYLWSSYLRWLSRSPRVSPHAGNADLLEPSFSSRLRDDHGASPSPKPACTWKRPAPTGTT